MKKQREHLGLMLGFANLELQPDKKDHLNDRAISDFIRFVVYGDVSSHIFSALVDNSEIHRLKKLEAAAEGHEPRR